MVRHLSVSKLDLAVTRTAVMALQVEKVIAISSHGNVDLQVQLLLGNNVAETIVVTTTIMMEVPHPHGRLVVAAAAAATTTAAMDKVVVVMVVLPAVELLLGNNRTMLLHLLPQAISMAMVDTQEAMEVQAAGMADSLPWALLLVLVEALAVLVPHQVWALYSRTMARTELQVVLLHHLLPMIFLPQ